MVYVHRERREGRPQTGAGGWVGDKEGVYRHEKGNAHDKTETCQEDTSKGDALLPSRDVRFGKNRHKNGSYDYEFD